MNPSKSRRPKQMHADIVAIVQSGGAPRDTVPFLHRGWIGISGAGVVLALVAFLAGCELADECELGQARCNGNAAQYCDTANSDSDRLVWTGADCGDGYCKLSTDSNSPKPFCATTETPDPRCSDGQDVEFCDGNVVIGCHQGYVEHSVDCRTGDSFGPRRRISPMPTGYCVAKEGAALCALASEPNPACPTDTVATAMTEPVRTVCAGDKLLTCFYEWAVLTEDCPTGGACVPHEYPFCALSQTREPECLENSAESAFCRNGLIEHCRYGWIVWEEACEGDTSCAMTSVGTPMCATK
jgi:hypothetical protein